MAKIETKQEAFEKISSVGWWIFVGAAGQRMLISDMGIEATIYLPIISAFIWMIAGGIDLYYSNKIKKQFSVEVKRSNHDNT